MACTKRKLNERTEPVITLGTTSELVMAVMELQAASAAAFYVCLVCDGLIYTSSSGRFDGSLRLQPNHSSSLFPTLQVTLIGKVRC